MSANNLDNSVSDVFSMATEDGYHLKVLSEIIKNIEADGDGSLIFSEGGMSFRGTNPEETLMVDVTINGSDTNYQPPEEENVSIGINYKNLNEVLKPVKKKDTLRVYQPLGSKYLYFEIKNKDSERDKTNYIHTKEVNKEAIDLPEYPTNPICRIAASEFQTTCKGSGTHQYADIFLQDKGIMISQGSDTKILGNNSRFGNWVAGVDPAGSIRVSHHQLSKALGKCGGLGPKGSFIKVFWTPGAPVMFETALGKIGTIRIFLTNPPSANKEN